MDKEIMESIQKIKDLVEDNNKMLHSVQRRARLATLWHVVYWVIIIGTAIGTFYYVQPYLDKVLSAYDSLQNTQKQINTFSQGVNLNALKGYFK